MGMIKCNMNAKSWKPTAIVTIIIVHSPIETKDIDEGMHCNLPFKESCTEQHFHWDILDLQNGWRWKKTTLQLIDSVSKINDDGDSVALITDTNHQDQCAQEVSPFSEPDEERIFVTCSFRFVKRWCKSWISCVKDTIDVVWWSNWPAMAINAAAWSLEVKEDWLPPMLPRPLLSLVCIWSRQTSHMLARAFICSFWMVFGVAQVLWQASQHVFFPRAYHPSEPNLMESWHPQSTVCSSTHWRLPYHIFQR